MLRSLNESSNGRRICGNWRTGSLASEILTTAFPLKGLLENDVDSGFPNRRYSVQIIGWSGPGNLFVEDNGALSFTGAPDGAYTATQRIKKWDEGVGLVSTADASISLTIGAGGSTSTITGVTVSPATTTVPAGSTRAFSRTVFGTGTFSQSVTWSTNLGQISTAGVLTPPAATGVVQTGLVTAKSDDDQTKFGTATFTVPAQVSVETYNHFSVTLQARDGASLAGLVNLKWALFSQATPDLFGAPVAQGAIASADIGIPITTAVSSSTVPIGRYWLVLTDSDGTTTQNPAARSYSCPIMVV